MKLLPITIALLVLDALVVGFAIAQKVADINLLPKSLEKFALALFWFFQVLTVTAYLISVIDVMARISRSLKFISGADDE